MADVVCNIAKGRVAELCNRVDLNDPAASALIVALLATSVESNATLVDKATFTGYARKALTEPDIVAFSADTVNDRVDLHIPDQSWTAVATLPGAISAAQVAATGFHRAS